LFSADESGRIRLAINPVVLQELLLRSDAANKPAFDFPGAPAAVLAARWSGNQLVQQRPLGIGQVSQ
jgi:hypothetical protein